MEIFEKFGAVTSAKVAMDKETGKSRGFAFVEMPNEAEAKDAIENLNDISLGKKPLVVKQAEERSLVAVVIAVVLRVVTVVVLRVVIVVVLQVEVSTTVRATEITTEIAIATNTYTAA